MEKNGEQSFSWEWDCESNSRPQPGYEPCYKDGEQQSNEQHLTALTTEVSAKHSATSWILQQHESWSDLTNHLFHMKLQEGELSERQYKCWLFHRALLSIAIHTGCVKTEAVLRERGVANRLPLLRIAEEDRNFFYSQLSGLFNKVDNLNEIESYPSLSHFTLRLISIIDETTGIPSKPVLALSVLWSTMFTSWQVWHLFISRLKWNNTSTAPRHLEVFEFISRNDAFSEITNTLILLDTVLNSEIEEADFENASRLFLQVLRGSIDVLDYNVTMEDSNLPPLCTCGRKGHSSARCAFKKHI